jgi:hypothetical protein
MSAKSEVTIKFSGSLPDAKPAALSLLHRRVGSIKEQNSTSAMKHPQR